MIPTSIDGTDITGATIDGSDVTEITVDGQTVFNAVNFPGVVDRNPDTSSSSETASYGLVFNANDDFDGIGARVSANTNGISRARIYDFTAGQYIATKTGLSLSAGDTFGFLVTIVSGQEYSIEVDNNGSSYTRGLRPSGGFFIYPVGGNDFDIVSQTSGNGNTDTQDYSNVNELGNPDGVLDNL